MFLAHPFRALIGKPLDQKTLKRSIEELYGWNIFESIRYEIIEEEDKQGLLVHVRDKSWGPNYLQSASPCRAISKATAPGISA